MSLREWTVWRVAAACALWVVLALGAAFAAAAAYAVARRGPPAPTATATAATGPAIVGPHLTVELGLGIVLLGLLGPPALLTAAWLWQRSRRR